MSKPTIENAKKDIASLEKAMNAHTIPDRKKGEEIKARTESGASVTISAAGESATVPLEELGTSKQAGRIAAKLIKNMKRGKAEQTEAAGLIPPLDGVGKAAKRMVEAVRAVANAAEEKGEAESNLIRALRKSKRTSFKCEGVEMFLAHRGPVDKIQIKKAK